MKKNSKIPSCQGKEVFVGIDVHKKTYSVVSIIDGIVAAILILGKTEH